MDSAAHILAIVDRSCADTRFPALDNGYFYLAASRLSLHRSDEDWAFVFELFGYSPREGYPSVYVETFASRLRDRNRSQDYVSEAAFERYLATHPHDDFRSFYPIDEGDWTAAEDGEHVAESATTVLVRGHERPLPSREAYARVGVELAHPDRVEVFELCRYLAAVDRDLVLASPTEQRVSVRPEMVRVLQLDAWYHPDVCEGALPCQSETFQQLAGVLETGDVGAYRPSAPPNTHWKNWPEGGTL